LTPTDEQIAEALAQADHGIMVAPLTVLASALRAAQERAEAYQKQDIERLREGQRLIDREKARAEKAEGEAKALSKLVRELIPTAVNWHQRLHDKAGIEAVMLDNLIEDARAAIREGKPVDLIATKNGKDY
jgi:hypothetical protein